MRAWELHEEGWSGKDVAEALKVSAAAVSGWLKRARMGGIEGLRSRPAAGPTPKLTAERRARPGRCTWSGCPPAPPNLNPDEWVWNLLKRR